MSVAALASDSARLDNTWCVGVEPLAIGATNYAVLWAVDEATGIYEALHIERAWSSRTLADCLAKPRLGVTRPDRVRFVGEEKQRETLARALGEHGIGSVGPMIETGRSDSDDARWGERLRREFSSKETMVSLEQAKTRIEEYRLQANLRRSAGFVEMSERLGRGLVQRDFAEESPDVLLLHLLNWFDAGRMSNEVFAPVGSSYIAASLEDAGYRVRLELFRHSGAEAAMPDSLRRWRPRLIGISATGFEIHELKMLSRSLDRQLPGVPIVVGGYCSMSGASLFEDSAIHVVVCGEGEQTVRELVPRLLAGESLEAVTGILYRDEEGVVREVDRRADVIDLDTLPRPRYTHIPPAEGIVRVSASRGCPYRCVFCSIKDFYSSSQIRYHGPEYMQVVIDELFAGHSAPYRQVVFNDDEFLLDPRHFRRMAQAARASGVQMCFETRVPDVIRHQDLIAANRDVVSQIYMGVESFSQAQLDRWKKGVSVAQNAEALNLLAELGIYSFPFLILFDAETTLDELRQNCEGILAMPPSPVPLVLEDGSRRLLSLTPVRRGVTLNRLLDFNGRSMRRDGTRYLEAVWFFLLATECEMRSLTPLYRSAVGYQALDDEDGRVGEIRDAIGALLDDRVKGLPDLAAEARNETTVDRLIALAHQHAERFRERSLLLTLDYLETHGAVSCLGNGSTPRSLQWRMKDRHEPQRKTDIR